MMFCREKLRESKLPQQIKLSRESKLLKQIKSEVFCRKKENMDLPGKETFSDEDFEKRKRTTYLKWKVINI